MKLTVPQEDLKDALDTVGHAVPHKSTLPILNCVLLSVDTGLHLSTTNLETSIHHEVANTDVEETGSIAVPYRLLADVVTRMPHEMVELSLGKTKLSLRCGRHKGSFVVQPADEFPIIPMGIPTEALNTTVAVNAEELRRAVEQTAFAAAKDGSRPTLQGVYLNISGNEGELQTTDGYRLSMRRLPIEAPAPPSEDAAMTSAIVPANAMSALVRIIVQQPACNVHIGLTENQAIFVLPGVVFVSQLIEGAFPDVRVIVPKSHTTQVQCDAVLLERAAKVASLFADPDNGIVTLDIAKNEHDDTWGITVSARSANVGDGTSTLPLTTMDGDALEINISGRYLLEALKTMGKGDATLLMTTPTQPIVVRPVGIEASVFTHVIMPMRPN